VSTFFTLLKEGETELNSVGIDNALFESELILVYSFGVSKEFLLQELNTPLNSLITKQKLKSNLKKFNQTLSRRKKRVPLAYIFRYCYFRNHRYQIRKGVLIPRPETELLVEKCIDIARAKFGDEPFYIVELGFGSGIIAIELGLAFPQAKVYAWDTSQTAYRLATANAKALGCDNVTFFCEDFFKGTLWKNLLSPDDKTMIVGNPPYIPDSHIKQLEPDVRLYEPKKALKGGKKGLDYYERILTLCKKVSPTMVFEIGIDQKRDLEDLLRQLNYWTYEFKNDLQNIPRVLTINE